MIAVVGVLNQFGVARECLAQLAARTSAETSIVAIDNGSDAPLADAPWLPDRVHVERWPENLGNWALFAGALDLAAGAGTVDHVTVKEGVRAVDARVITGDREDVVAVLHSDLIVWEDFWDSRVAAAFARDPKLGLLGFVGAKQILAGGGRSVTMVNFQGRLGTHARDHGFQLPTFESAACVDGCAMVFRREFLRQAWDPDWPPHHFYDKEFSCRALASGWRVAYLGVACDHMGGETVSREPKYHDLARRWCVERGIADHPDAPGNWDRAVYLEAQRRFLRRWEQEASFLPVNVREDWSVAHDERV